MLFSSLLIFITFLSLFNNIIASSTIRAKRGDASLDNIFFDLSVNFLLYVVLIIVFYLFVRFYLEEENENQQNNGYSKVSTNEEEETLIDSSIEMESADTTLELEKNDEDEIKSQIKESNNDDDSLTSNSPIKSPKSTLKRSHSFLNINEWGEPEGTKEEVIQRVITCAAGLIISFCIWGLVQERILTQTYDNDYFEYSYGLVFLSRLGGLGFSVFLMWYYNVEWVKTPVYEYAFPSIANMLSSWCQYEALKYVSFPTQMLAKAFKVVPVMIMGKLMNNKSYESYEYVSSFVVGIGLYLFINSSEHISFDTNIFGEPESVKGVWCGIILLILYLFFDSFTGQWQTRMFQINKALSPLQMMLTINGFSAVFSFITLVHQEDLVDCFSFIFNHPSMIFHVVIFIIFSTVGQLFIFYTVKNFGAVVFSIIMSIRILFSTIISCLVYSHPITELGFLGICIVFGAVAFRIKRKTEGQSLIRWRETEEAKDIFHEWHEHLDI
jgi:adenosine 3'-phospho 5'-phosphosulfate transporter B2